MPIDKNQSRKRIHMRVRKKIKGTAERPRLNVYRSNRYIYAQLIDDTNGHTLTSASSYEKDFDQSGSKIERGKRVGVLIAERAKAKGIESVVFDRGGYLYHGRVKALADGAREGGLKL